MRGSEWHLEFGANLLGPEQTRFRIWAPGQKKVLVAIEGREPLAMTACSGGWFEIVVNCGPGTRIATCCRTGLPFLIPPRGRKAMTCTVRALSSIQHLIYGATSIGADGHGKRLSFTNCTSAFSVVLAESARELPRLAALGITAVELMPVAEFPGARNWGYDGVLPFAPESSYGKPDELKSLVDAAHDHGLMIFLDVVYNHFGPDGNYLARYAPDMFRNDVTTPWGPAIDFRQKEVRQFFTENALYWLIEYRFDGLRFDAVHAITEPDWLDEMAAEVRHRFRIATFIWCLRMMTTRRATLPATSMRNGMTTAIMSCIGC